MAFGKGICENTRPNGSNCRKGKALSTRPHTYLLVAGAVNVTSIGGSSKNSFPQLPQTSPASIARVLVAMNPALEEDFDSLASPLRLLESLVGPPRNLPKKGYAPETALLSDLKREQISILSGDELHPPRFDGFGKALLTSLTFRTLYTRLPKIDPVLSRKLHSMSFGRTK